MAARLIFDVGMHRGEDTDFYLRRGFEVVGVEANPFLVAEVTDRFLSHIRSGQLRIVNKAIGSKPGKARFAVNSVSSVWGTLIENFADRNAAQGFPSGYIEVECITFTEVLRQQGIPYYLKIDIEGCDMLCIEALRDFSQRPKYLSLETCATSPGYGFRDVLGELRVLRRLGYSRFKYVNQASIPGSERQLSVEGSPVVYRFPPDSSGPFGEETPGRWLRIGAAGVWGLALRAGDDVCGHSGRLYGRAGVWRLRDLRHRLTGRQDHWYDLHARLG